MKRIGIFLIEIIAAIAFCLFVGIGFLMARLEQGPVSLQKYLPEIEGAVSDLSPGLVFKIDGAQLESNEKYRTIRMHLQNVHLFNKDKQSVGALKDVMLGFNWHNLTGLSYMPVALEMSSPKLTITRFANGYTGFNLEEVETDPQHAASITDLSSILSHLPKELRHVRITDAALRYVDKQQNTTLIVSNGLFELNRTKHSVTGTLNVNIAMGDFSQRIQGTIYQDEKDKQLSHIAVALKNFRFNQIRNFIPQVPAELKLDMPMDILLSATMDMPLKLKDIDLQVTAKEGTLQYAPYFPQVLPLSDVFAKISYLPDENKIHLQSFGAKLEQSPLLAVGSVKKDGDNKEVILKAMVENVPVDKLPVYWPVGLGKNARDWVTTHIQSGTANRGIVTLNASLLPNDAVKINELKGRINFEHSDLNYLPPMPEAKDISGQCRFNDQHFDIAATSGQLFDTKLSEAVIRISDLLTEDPRIAISVDMNGPIHDGLAAISSKPLEFTQKMGMVPDNFSGNAHTKLFLQFPLLNDLKLEQMRVDVVSELQNLSARNIVKDLSLSAKAMDMKVNEKELFLDGDALLADAPSHVTWHEDFSGQGEYGTVVDADGKITPALMKGLRIPSEKYFAVSAQAKSHIAIDRRKTTNVAVKADLAGAEINLPELNVEKRPGTPGTLDLKLAVDKDGMTTISDSSVSWNNFGIANAAVKFSDANGIQSATLNDIRAGRSRAELVVTPSGNDAISVVVKADTLDLSSYWTKKKTIDDKPSTKKMSLSLKANTLFLDPEIPLKNFKADLVTIGSDLHHGLIAAQTENNGSLALQETESKDNSRHLAAKITNAGYVLRALDITDAVHDGTLTLIGDSKPASPSVIEGKLELTKFSMVNAPVLARLLNAMSPGGLINLLNTKGLYFSKLESNYSLPDAKTVKVSKGRMNGDSLGLSFGGTVNREDSTMDITGTIVPLEGINKFANIIPIFGKILTGVNGNGIIGATYRISGQSGDPSVFVNPLSALTPGILRSILFENSND